MDDAAFEAELTDLRGGRGAAAVSRLADLARRAEAANREDLARRGRLELLRAALSSDEREGLVLPTFARVVADAEADPHLVGPDELLTMNVEALRSVTREHAVPRDRVEALLKDLARRGEAAGADRAAALEARLHARSDMGDLEALPGLLRELCDARGGRDAARTRTDRALAGIYTGHAGHALAAMRPVVRFDAAAAGAWSMRSSYVVWLLRPLVWVGAEAEAAAVFPQARRAANRWSFGEILALEYAARTRDQQALGPLLRAVLRASGNLVPDFRMQAANAAASACEALAAAGDRPRTLRLPGEEAAVRRRPSEAAGPLREEADALAARFDARNGNGHITRQVRAVRALAAGSRGVEQGEEDVVGVDPDRRRRLRALWEETFPPGYFDDPAEDEPAEGVTTEVITGGAAGAGAPR